MATYDLEEEEQIEELKTWWKLHGLAVTAVLAVLAIALASWQGWNYWQRREAAAASALYAALTLATEQQNAKQARDIAGEIISKYGGTAYAGLAALVAANAQLAPAGDAKSAQAQLGWAMDHATDAGLRDLARLRLAALQIDDKAWDAALQTLSATPQAAFAARFAELRGDALLLQGKKAEAKSAYQAALDALEKSPVAGSASYSDIVRDKLEQAQ